MGKENSFVYRINAKVTRLPLSKSYKKLYYLEKKNKITPGSREDLYTKDTPRQGLVANCESRSSFVKRQTESADKAGFTEWHRQNMLMKSGLNEAQPVDLFHTEAKAAVLCSSCCQQFNSPAGFFRKGQNAVCVFITAKLSKVLNQTLTVRLERSEPIKTYNYIFDEDYKLLRIEGTVSYSGRLDYVLDDGYGRNKTTTVLGALQLEEVQHFVIEPVDGSFENATIYRDKIEIKVDGDSPLFDFAHDLWLLDMQGKIDELEQRVSNKMATLLALTNNWKTIEEEIFLLMEQERIDYAKVKAFCEAYLLNAQPDEFARSCRAAVLVLGYLKKQGGSKNKKRLYKDMLSKLFNKPEKRMPVDSSSEEESEESKEEAKGEFSLSLEDISQRNQLACQEMLQSKEVIDVLGLDRNRGWMIAAIIILFLVFFPSAIIVLCRFRSRDKESPANRVESMGILQESLAALSPVVDPSVGIGHLN